MRRTIVKYVLIALAITVIWTIIEHVLGYNTTKHEIGQYTRIIPTLIYWALVVIAILEVKRKQHGVISFRQAMNTGTGVVLGYSLLVTIWFCIYAEVINPDYQPTLMAFEKSKIENSGATQAEIDEKMKEVEMTSGGTVTSYFLLFLFMAMFATGITLITSAIVRTRRTLVA